MIQANSSVIYTSSPNESIAAQARNGEVLPPISKKHIENVIPSISKALCKGEERGEKYSRIG